MGGYNASVRGNTVTGAFDSVKESLAIKEFSDQQILFIKENEALLILYKALDHIKDPWLLALKKKELLKAYEDAEAGVNYGYNIT